MRKQGRAFALIEMAIILVILGLLIGATMPLLFQMTKHRHYRDTQEDLEAIGEALAGYAGIRGKLPPADTNGDGVGDANQTSGFLPYLDLGLGAVDAWRNRYYYDVNSRLLPTASKAALCTAISSIAAAELPQLAFSSGWGYQRAGVRGALRRRELGLERRKHSLSGGPALRILHTHRHF